MNARNFAKLIPAVLVVTAMSIVSVACSKEDPTATPATPTTPTPTAPTGAPPADEAATAKEVDDLAKEIEADLADEG